MGNQNDLLSDAGYAQGDWLVAAGGRTPRHALTYHAAASEMTEDIIALPAPMHIWSQAWRTSRWVGLFLLEILLVPVSRRRPPKWSVIRPLAERFVLWWDRRIAKR